MEAEEVDPAELTGKQLIAVISHDLVEETKSGKPMTFARMNNKRAVDEVAEPNKPAVSSLLSKLKNA